MADISETLLQVAQVVNQSYSMVAKAQSDRNELEVRRQNYADMARAREEKLANEEQAFQAKQELAGLKNQVDLMRVDLERQRVGIAQQNADTGTKNAATQSYKVKVQTAIATNKVSHSDAEKLRREIEGKVVGVLTGDPALDKGLVFQTQSDLRHMWGQANAVVEAGAPLPPALQAEARLLRIPDQDYALGQRTKVEKLLQFRDAFAKDKLIPEYKQREANVLNSMSFLEDAQQTNDTSAQRGAADQAAANGDTGTKSVLGAKPGVISNGGQLSLKTHAFLSKQAGYTPEILQNPDSFRAATQDAAQGLRELQMDGDFAGLQAAGAALVNTNPGLARAVSNLLLSLNGQKE